MKWVAVDAYAIRSECCRFTICKFWIRDELFYELHEGKTMIATRLPSADSAKALVAQLEAEKMNSNSFVEGSHRADEPHSVVICDGVAR